MSFFEVLLLLISIVALVVVALLAVLAAVRITQVAGYSGDSDLQRAHKYLTWASIIAWIAVFIIVLLLSFYVSRLNISSDAGSIFSSEVWVRVLIFVIFVLAVALSILIFLGLTDVNKSALSSRASTLGVQSVSGWAGGIAIATAVAILLAFFFSLYNRGEQAVARQVTTQPTAEARPAEPAPARGGLADLPEFGTGGAEGGELGEALEFAEANPEILLA